MNYRDFRITIDNDRATYKVPDKVSDFDDDDDDKIHSTLRDREHNSRWRAVDMLSRWIERSGGSKPGVVNPVVGRDAFELLGTFLYEILFGKDIEQEFEKALSSAQKQPDTKLRLVLHFKPNADKLATLPWEYLYRPDNEKTGQGFFFAADDGLVLSRQVPLKISFPSADRKALRVLAVVSSPSDELEIKPDAVIEEMQELKKLKLVEFDRLDQPSKATFKEKIEHFKPHIVHFFGHGRYIESEERGELAFVNPGVEFPSDEEKLEVGRAQWVADQAIADSCKVHCPRLVFLQACEGAATNSYEAFAGVGLKLVRARVPGVVAMKYEITTSHARMFARTFYRGLAAGLPIDAAVQAGRNALGHGVDKKNNFNNRAFGTPIVYLQSKSIDSDYRIVSGTGEQPSAPSESDTSEVSNDEKVLCAYRDLCDAKVFRTGKRCGKCNRPYVICAKCREAIVPDATICEYCGKAQADASVRQAPPPIMVNRANEASVIEKKDAKEAPKAPAASDQLSRTPTDPRLWNRNG